MKALKHQAEGDYYTKMKIQPWEIIEAHELNFWEGNIIKYILRKKGEKVIDLKKAKHYLEYLIEKEINRSIKKTK